MNSVVLLVLLVTSIVANSDNEDPSDYLMEKWSTAYDVLSQHYSPRCVRSCNQSAGNVFWHAIFGDAIQDVLKSRFLEILTDQYKNNTLGNMTLGVQFLDADQNGFISAEEFYTEYLCLGFELERIEKIFDAHHPQGKGIKVSDHIAALVEYATEPDEEKENYRFFEELKNI